MSNGILNFGACRRKVTKRQEQVLDRCAREAGAHCWFTASVPGCYLTGWGEAVNRGHPFDQELTDRFWALVDQAGLGHLFE